MTFHDNVGFSVTSQRFFSKEIKEYSHKTSNFESCDIYLNAPTQTKRPPPRTPPRTTRDDRKFSQSLPTRARSPFFFPSSRTYILNWPAGNDKGNLHLKIVWAHGTRPCPIISTPRWSRFCFYFRMRIAVIAAHVAHADDISNSGGSWLAGISLLLLVVGSGMLGSFREGCSNSR